ncbi:MAG: hypothetical protein NZ805_07810 [Armatimonadetes bacterium]|nr:hypothetical protein [Armatimonadota bacterium]MDW8027035.1 hypothetical protein [Armatimonadota bacterium]
MVIDRNLYWASSGQKLILYGVLWRPKYREFSEIGEWSKATGFDRNSIVSDPRFANFEADDFSLLQESPARILPAGKVDGVG